MHTKVIKCNRSYNRSQLQYSIKTLAIKILHKKVDNCGSKKLSNAVMQTKVINCNIAKKVVSCNLCTQKLSQLRRNFAIFTYSFLLFTFYFLLFTFHFLLFTFYLLPLTFYSLLCISYLLLFTLMIMKTIDGND